MGAGESRRKDATRLGKLSGRERGRGPLPALVSALLSGSRSSPVASCSSAGLLLAPGRGGSGGGRGVGIAPPSQGRPHGAFGLHVQEPALGPGSWLRRS